MFNGGTHCIAIETIRTMANCKNYECITQTIYCFDSIISGNRVQFAYWRNINHVHETLLRHLIDNYLNPQKYDRKLDDYTYDTFECLVDHKDHICIDIHVVGVQEVNNMMRDLVVHGTKSGYVDKAISMGDMTNVFKNDLLEIFKPKTIVIQNWHGRYTFMISLWSLLSVIKDSVVQEIALLLGPAKECEKLTKMHPITSELRDAYNLANYTISDLEENQGRIDCIIKFKS